MAFAITAKVEGVEEVVKALDKFKQGVRNRILRKATRKGASIIVSVVRANVPKDSGLLKKSIGIRMRSYRNSGIVVAVVGPRSGFKQGVATKSGSTVLRNPTKYAHLIEWGHRLVRGGKAVGYVPGTRPIMRALDATKGAVTAAVKAVIADEIPREVAKAAVKGKTVYR